MEIFAAYKKKYSKFSQMICLKKIKCVTIKNWVNYFIIKMCKNILQKFYSFQSPIFLITSFFLAHPLPTIRQKMLCTEI